MQPHLTAVILLEETYQLQQLSEIFSYNNSWGFFIVINNYKRLFSLRSINLVIKLLADERDFKHLY